jgi:sulfur carrier protein ThiS
MIFYLRVYGHLEQYNQQSLDWVKRETNQHQAEKVLKELGFPLDEVCFLVKNGQFMSWEDHIEEEDRIELVPPIEGG